MSTINRTEKPKRSAAQLVKQLEAKGVEFNIVSRVEAYKFLRERNNYMRLASYRKNYQKDKYGKRKGKYKNLEFAYLIELSTLDMYLRQHIMKMCLDIEHCLKVKMLSHIENNAKEDGYQIVNDFLNEPKNSYIIGAIQRKNNATYSGDLTKHYFCYTYQNGKYMFDCPAWVLTELLQFGDFLNFYSFYCARYKVKCIEKPVLNLVKSLRNACTHNNCMLHDLHKGDSSSAPTNISKYVSRMQNIGQQERKSKLSTQFLLEFIGLIYVYDKVVSADVKKYTYLNLNKFAHGRLISKKFYFDKNYLLKTSIDFLQNAIDNLQ